MQIIKLVLNDFLKDDVLNMAHDPKRCRLHVVLPSLAVKLYY
jgi:hypothetical protein